MVTHVTKNQISPYAQCGVYIDSLGPDSFVRVFSPLVTCEACWKTRISRMSYGCATLEIHEDMP